MCQGRCFQPGPWPVCGARLTRYTRSHPAALGSWASPTSPARHCRPPSCVTTGWGSGWVPTVPLPAQRSCSVLGLGTAVPQFPHLQVDFPVAFSCPGAGAVVWMTPETCVSTIPPMGAHGPFGPRRGAGCWWLRGARAGGPWAGAVPGLCQTWGGTGTRGSPAHLGTRGRALGQLLWEGAGGAASVLFTTFIPQDLAGMEPGQAVPNQSPTGGLSTPWTGWDCPVAHPMAEHPGGFHWIRSPQRQPSTGRSWGWERKRLRWLRWRGDMCRMDTPLPAPA